MFTDECLGNKWVYRIKENINAFEGFQLFLTHVEEIYGFKVTTLRTYMEYEWSTIKLRDFLKRQGINHQYAASGHEQEEPLNEVKRKLTLLLPKVGASKTKNV